METKERYALNGAIDADSRAARARAATAFAMSELRVAHAAMVAQDIRMFELVDPDGRELPAFEAGSHISVLTPAGVPRQYSLCNAPSERHRYLIAVKREAQGRGGSASMVDSLAEGDALPVSAPRNAFPLAPGAAHYLFIAGGIGITPIRSMIAFLETQSTAPYTLYYCTRTPAQTAFLDEFQPGLRRGKLVVHHDEGEPERAMDLWPVLEQPGRRQLYCCGPRPLMQAVRDMTGHWPASSVHFEDFAGEPPPARPDDKAFEVRLASSDRVIGVAADQTILQALRDAGLHVPSSCESGTCGSCRTRLLGGCADHRDFVLTADEKERDIMVCVSRAQTEELLLDL